MEKNTAHWSSLIVGFAGVFLEAFLSIIGLMALAWLVYPPFALFSPLVIFVPACTDKGIQFARLRAQWWQAKYIGLVIREKPAVSTEAD